MLETDILPLTADDLAALHALQLAAHREELHEPQTLFAKMLDFPRSINLGLWVDGILQGYIVSYAAEPGRRDFTAGPRRECDPALLYLHDLCISPDLQGHGLGRTLYNEFEALALKEGYKDIIANAIDGHVQFWEKQGFITGVQTSYHGVPATRIEKFLQDKESIKL